MTSSVFWALPAALFGVRNAARAAGQPRLGRFGPLRGCALALVLLPCVSAAPKGLSDPDWAAIRKEHMRHRQAAYPAGGGWKARNFQQNWSTYFDGRGFEVTPSEASWRWGLTLAAYGYPGQRRIVKGAKLAADVEKFWYQWDSDLREWYINGAGLEHGYTLAARPGKGKGLQFDLEIRGTLQAEVARDGRSVAFLEPAGGRAVVRYSGLKATDAAGRELDARLVLHEHRLRLEIDDADARYPITVDPIAQQARLVASNPDASDSFGFSVSVYEDVALVGAPNEAGNGSSEADNSLVRAGAAYLFRRQANGEWTQFAYLKASNPGPASGDTFGYSVAIYRDSIVVGAPGKTSIIAGQTRVQMGSAYVFNCNAAPCRPLQEAFLQGFYGTSVVPRGGDRFGSSVAITGNPSYAHTIVVGSPYYDGPGETPWIDAGAAFVYARNVDISGVVTWPVQAYLQSPLVSNGGNFGRSVAVSGDTAVVGETQTGLITFGGRAYVFAESSGSWPLQAVLAGSNTGAGDGFGTAVAVDGDTAVIGAPGEDSNGTSPSDNSLSSSGAAYVYTRNGAAWSQQAFLKAPSPTGNEQFGYAVGTSGGNVVVGGPGVPGVGSLPGSVYVFRSGAATPINSANGAPRDQFGCSVGVSGDTVIVGACNELAGGRPAAGAAYIFGDYRTPVSIAISAPLVSIPKGTTDQFTAIGTYSDGSTADITAQAAWGSSDPAVTITAAGLATGAAAGVSNITASLNGIVSNSFQLTVSPPALAFVNISAPDTWIPWGTTEQFAATGTYADNTTANITSQVNWNSSNTAAVSISNAGLATAAGLGSSNITASIGGVISNGFTLGVRCANDISSTTIVTRGAITFNFLTNRFVQQVTVKNNHPNGLSVTGPVSLVLDNLSPITPLANASGVVSCNLPGGKFISLAVGIPLGQEITFTLQFTNPTFQNITYSTRVLAGAYPR